MILCGCEAKRAYLAEQVESQACDPSGSGLCVSCLCSAEAYSRRDIERLHAERSHLRQLFKDLKAEPIL